MIRKIKPNLFTPGNVVIFNAALYPHHDCVGLKLRVIKERGSRSFSAEILEKGGHYYPVGYKGENWTKEYYIQAPK